MIGAQGVRRGGPEEEMIRLAQQGKIETILDHKKIFALEELFQCPKDNCPPPPPPSPSVPQPQKRTRKDPFCKVDVNLLSLLRPNPRTK